MFPLEILKDDPFGATIVLPAEPKTSVPPVVVIAETGSELPEKTSSPAETVVAPVYVLAPDSVRVFAPVLATEPDPEITPATHT